MVPDGKAHFERGCLYTRTEIQAACGGSRRAALPSRAGDVVCACLIPEKNPRAPAEMLIADAERSLRLARAFATSGRAVPVFVRVRPGAWEYAGERRVRALIEEPGALLALIAEGAPPETALALLLEEPLAAQAGPAVHSANVSPGSGN